MIDGALLSTTTSLALQQKDNLCGPFHVARVLLEAGVTEWDGMPIDQDLVALHAGTTLPADPRGPQVPAGAPSLQDYRHDLPRIGRDTRAGARLLSVARMERPLSAAHRCPRRGAHSRRRAGGWRAGGREPFGRRRCEGGGGGAVA